MSRTRTDGNQKEIIEKWMKIPGASYVDLHNVRNGCPDLLFGYGGFNFLFEVKNKGGKMTPKQILFFKEHKGHRDVVFSFEEVLEKVLNFLLYEVDNGKWGKFRKDVKQIHGINL